MMTMMPARLVSRSAWCTLPATSMKRGEVAAKNMSEPLLRIMLLESSKYLKARSLSPKSMSVSPKLAKEPTSQFTFKISVRADSAR